MEPKIFHFMDEREAIIRDTARRVISGKIADAERSAQRGLEYLLNEAAYYEMQRLEKGSSKLDLRPYGYWKQIARTVGKASDAEKERILTELVEEYCRDVAGKFTPSVYRFTSRVLPVGLSVLFNAQSLDTLFGNFKSIGDRVIVQGRLEQLRRLAEIGTLVVVPTHSSNLDSIVVGWGLDQAGLPPVTYGAGKNLFTNPLMSFFMHNLGAYKVDRRLRHSLYKDVLKTYSEVLLQRRYHSLFFPGGTRSRTNRLESKLKLGLLGSALTAYTNNLLEGRENPRIFVCPMTINFQLVLEAETLIADALRTDGGARFIIEDDEFRDIPRVLGFVMKMMNMEHTLYLRFGEPLDPFGNEVDEEGESLDPHGRRIDIEKYLWSGTSVKADRVRDGEYTRACGRAIVEVFRRNTVVLSTAFLAFLVFQHLRSRYPGLDLYRLLRVSKDDAIPYEEICAEGERLRRELRERASRNELCLADDVATLSIRELIDRPAKVFGTYHATPAVRTTSTGLTVANPNLLYFYANRLADRGLEELFEAGAAAKVSS